MDDLNLPEGWEVRKLGEVANVIGGGTPSTKKSEYWNGDIPWITPKDLSNYSFKYICKGERNISREGLKNSSAKLLPPGTILLSSRAPIGYVAIAKNELTTNQGFRSFITNEDKLNYEFLYYWLKTKKKVLESLAGGSTFKEISGTTIKNLEILLPPLKEQQKIAEILSSLDEKIELNIKMNKTLEEMAKAIFKRWFIDFEFPNEEGKPYKSSGGEFINSELGEIPKGWRVEKLKNICLKLASGGTPSRKNENFFNGDILWAKTKELNDNYILDTEEKISEEALYKSSAKLFPKNSVVMAIYASPTVGKLGILSKEATFNQAACGMVVNEEMVSYEYLFLYLLSQREYLNNLASGAAQQNLNVSIVKNLDILIPKIDIIKKFKKIANPIFNQILNNQKEIQTLTKIRDTLLPKLITGKIRVRV